LRQFHQIGVEVFGSTHPTVDAEVLDLLSSLLKEVGLEGSLFKINSVGCRSCKSKYGELLRDSLRPRLSELCSDCQRRFEKNVLRVLDCKNENCQNVLSKIPLLPEVLCEECKDHFQKLQELLGALGVAFELAPKLVRGLDYYTRTIFEVTHSSLGAQDAIAAGGRYDLLVESLGGPSLGAVGFGIGIERLILALGEKFASRKGPYKPLFFLASLGENAFRLNFLLHKDLRNLKIPCEMDYDAKSFKSQLRRANKLGVRYVLLRGDDEINRGIIKFKDMEKGVEEEIEIDQIKKVIHEKFNSETPK
jgi:histidyl-tRNA synthetase